jgi:hypothetical protein
MFAVKRPFQGVDNARAPRIRLHHLRPRHDLQSAQWPPAIENIAT